MTLILQIAAGFVIGKLFWWIFEAIMRTWIIPFFIWLDHKRKESEQK